MINFKHRFFSLGFAVLSILLLNAGIAFAKGEKEPAKKELKTSYRLQQSDIISVKVYDEPDLKLASIIGKSGTVSFSLIGSVEVRGLTVVELEKKLKTLYEKDYLVNAKVNVQVTSYAKKWVTVSGAVENPGPVPYPEDEVMTLSTAVALAGGVMETGNSKNITLARKQGGTKKYTLITGAKASVYPGDTVVVQRLPLVDQKEKMIPTCTVSGEVKRPGNVAVMNGKIDIITAIAQAGGFSAIANPKKVIYQKKSGKGYKKIKVNIVEIEDGDSPMIYLRPGDILTVKQSIW